VPEQLLRAEPHVLDSLRSGQRQRPARRSGRSIRETIRRWAPIAIGIVQAGLTILYHVARKTMGPAPSRTRSTVRFSSTPACRALIRDLRAMEGSRRRDAITTTRRLAATQGLLVGTSSGANVWAAAFIARALGPTHNVVTVLPDRAERYFSTAPI
jgi:cysteine synthase